MVLDNVFFTDNFLAMNAVSGGTIFTTSNVHSFGNITSNGTATQAIAPQ
jgi:hypothetical protein